MMGVLDPHATAEAAPDSGRTVLIATDSFAPKIDGVADTAQIVSRLLAAHGHRVVVIAPEPNGWKPPREGAPPARVAGATVVRIPSVPLPFYREVRTAYRLKRVGQAVRHTKPDAAIVLTTGPIGVAAIRALPSSVPMVHVYTTDVPAYLRAYHLGLVARPAERLVRWMCNRAIATLCPTPHVRDELALRGHPRLEVWGRGVDEELFAPRRRNERMRARLTGGELDKPLVLYVGRLAAEKRLMDLCDAAAMLPNVRFAFIGDGPQRDALERRNHQMRAVFTGYLRGLLLAEAFACADVFAFPSDTDTFGQVVLQAMASGVPPVVVAGSAPAQLVPEGIAGLHVPARDPRALANAIQWLTAHPDARDEMGSAARKHALRYSWDTLVERLEALLFRDAPVAAS